MKKNMGLVDRSFRILVAINIVILYFSNLLSGEVAFVLLAFSVVFIITSLVSFCPLYLPCGIRTNKK